MKIALTIAGSDSGGGAGIQADLKTFQQFGVFGTSVVVALTAQNTRRRPRCRSGPRGDGRGPARRARRRPAAGRAQDRHAGGRRRSSGWSPRPSRAHGWAPLVVDPVMVSTSGDRLLTAEAEDVIRESLAAARRDGDAEPRRGRDPHRPRGARRRHAWSAPARRSSSSGAAAALVKGGHLTATEHRHRRARDAGGVRHFTHPRLATTSHARHRLHALGGDHRGAGARPPARARRWPTRSTSCIAPSPRAPGLGAGPRPARPHRHSYRHRLPRCSAAQLARDPVARPPSPPGGRAWRAVTPAAGLVIAEKPRQRMPTRARGDHLEHGRHPHRVGAQPLEHADLGRRLVARAQQARRTPPRRAGSAARRATSRAIGAQARRRTASDMSGKRSSPRQRRADQRVPAR